jgi:O-antigen ligase
VIAWVTFLAGGVYPFVWVPAVCAVALLSISVRPRIAADPSARPTDLLLALTTLAVAIQAVPLPQSILRAVDPQALALRASLWLPPAGGSSAALIPLTIVPNDTFAAAGILAGAVLLFWTCREICGAGGAGRIVRAVALIGMIASVAAIVQRAQSHELLYGVWRPVEAGARPYGPFVNRNHFATWVVMACPLVFGYLLARVPARRPSQLVAQRLVAALKQLGSIRIWLAASVCVMTLALLISASRSGLIALMCAMIVSLLFRTGAARPTIRRWTIFQLALLVLVAVSFANFDALVDRFDQTLRPAESGRGRSAVWADARRVIHDFPLTGTGAGTFGTAIGVYQTAEPGYSIGNAHNHYLQVAAEGGLLVSVPAASSIIAFFALCLRRVGGDRSPDYLMRAGALAGIAAVLVQSVWETGLRMPANAMLLAVLAAIATHAPHAGGRAGLERE